VAIESRRGERVALNRQTVVDAALALVDLEGLEALTFRRLAGDLGVTPMALYRYVSSKDELLAAMKDRVFEQFELPDNSISRWQDRLRMLGRSYRRVLLAHPSAAAFEQSGASAPSVDGLRVVEVILGVLRQAGFSLEQAAVLHETLSQFVLALVLLETGGGGARSVEELDLVRRELRAKLLFVPASEFPNVIEAADYLCGRTEREAAFELALDLVIGGLERLLERDGS
jgi:AcrR family transcriptional regulator